MRNAMPRRTFLKGVGTAMALPFLEAMTPIAAAAQAKTTPVRMAFMFVPNGVNMAGWTPGAAGSLQELTPILKPLAKVKDSVNVLTGLAQMNAFALGDGPGDHARSTAAWLTGVHPRKTAGSDIKVGISVDQVAAQMIGNQTRFASIEIGCERGQMAGDCDSGYSCAYSSNISWRGEATPNAKEVNPRLVFERLFGSGGESELAENRAKRDLYKKSILDFVMEDAEILMGKLGIRDQQKLEEYFAGIRELEQRLTKFEKEGAELALAGVNVPAGVPRDRGEHIRLMGDMMVLAFQGDVTRVCTFMFANDGSNRPYREIGINEGHHDVSHHGKSTDKITKKEQIDIYHVQQLAYILEKMQSIKEGDSTLLDNSMIVYGAGISDGDRHNHDDLPLLIAGKAGGRLRSGRHLIYKPHTPMNNLFVSMLDRVGVPIESLGDSTGKLTELF